MIPSLSQFDDVTAAGILARMALAIDDDSNPASAPRLQNERELRARVLNYVCHAVGLSPDDQSVNAAERVADYLDQEGDQLTSFVDSDSVLEGLGTRGELPSDLYKITVNLEILRFYGSRYRDEGVRIKETVSNPDKEQHFGEPKEDGQPSLISLFAKRFTDAKFSARSFTLLIAGQRRGRKLNIVQVWRIYDDSVDVLGAKDLVDLLRRFSEAYGTMVDVNGEKAKFFLLGGPDVDIHQITTTLEVAHSSDSGKQKSFSTNITQFVQHIPGTDKIASALVIAVDVNKYVKLLNLKKW